MLEAVLARSADAAALLFARSSRAALRCIELRGGRAALEQANPRSDWR